MRDIPGFYFDPEKKRYFKQKPHLPRVEKPIKVVTNFIWQRLLEEHNIFYLRFPKIQVEPSALVYRLPQLVKVYTLVSSATFDDPEYSFYYNSEIWSFRTFDLCFVAAEGTRFHIYQRLPNRGYSELMVDALVRPDEELLAFNLNQTFFDYVFSRAKSLVVMRVDLLTGRQVERLNCKKPLSSVTFYNIFDQFTILGLRDGSIYKADRNLEFIGKGPPMVCDIRHLVGPYYVVASLTDQVSLWFIGDSFGTLVFTYENAGRPESDWPHDPGFSVVEMGGSLYILMLGSDGLEIRVFSWIDPRPIHAISLRFFSSGVYWDFAANHLTLVTNFD